MSWRKVYLKCLIVWNEKKNTTLITFASLMEKMAIKLWCKRLGERFMLVLRGRGKAHEKRIKMKEFERLWLC